eukprot:g5288.t1
MMGGMRALIIASALTLAQQLPGEALSPVGGYEENLATREPPASRKLQETTQIDVMMLYFDSALEWADWTETEMEDEIHAAIAETNQAFENSSIDLVFNLVHVQKAPFEQAGTSFGEVAANTDVQDLRDAYEADVVQAIGDYSTACGRAGYFNGDPDRAYSVVSVRCLDELSVTHEFGHTLGCGHNREAVIDENEHDYAHGEIYCDVEDPADGYGTVMSVGCGDGGLIPRVPYFSNPDVEYLGKATGTTDEDNARRISENMAEEIRQQKRLCQETEKKLAESEARSQQAELSARSEAERAAQLEEDNQLAEQLALQREWVAAKQREMLQDVERQKKQLEKKAAALMEENAIAKRKLAKETTLRMKCGELIDMLPDAGRPKMACAQQQLQPEEATRIMAADARGHYDWPHEKVYEADSSIAGKGLFSKVDIGEGQVVMTALIPDEPVTKAFEDSDYSCYKHIMHKDGQIALAIDPGSKIGGNGYACKNDNDIRFLRLLNHCKTPKNVYIDVDVTVLV